MSTDRWSLHTPSHDRRQMVRRQLEACPWAAEAKAFNRFVGRVGMVVCIVLLPICIAVYCSRPSSVPSGTAPSAAAVGDGAAIGGRR